MKHKYNAIPTIVDDIRFGSKGEAKRYCELKLLKRAGEVLYFLMQVPFHLEGGIKYICDFLVFWKDGSHTVEDYKGFKTQVYKLKKKLVENQYPIKITEI